MSRTQEIKELLGVYEENRKHFLERIKTLPQEDVMKIDMAYDLAKESHRPQKRDSGERYFEHLRSVAIILIDECHVLDTDLIIAALLHDTIEDSPIFGNSTLAYSEWKKTAKYRLSRIFNSQVAEIVIGLTKPKADGKEIKSKQEACELYLDNLRKAPAETILIKMCDRLHNLRTLKGTTPEKQARKSKETVEEYFPIFEGIADKYPTQWKYLMDQMKKELTRFSNVDYVL